MEFEARVYGSTSRDVIYVALIWMDEGILCMRTIDFTYKENEVQTKSFTYLKEKNVVVSFEKKSNDVEVKIKVSKKEGKPYIRAHVTSFVSAYTLIKHERNLFSINS